MPAPQIEVLVGDARLLAEYAARNGRLPPDSLAFELIGEYEADPAAGNRSAFVASLCREIDILARAIAPVTLRQLQRRGSFVGHARLVMASIAPFAIGFLTLLLTLYLAFQSSQLHQANTAIQEYQEWVKQQPKEKLYAAWKMYRYERVLNVKTPPLAQLDAYQKLIEDARQLIDKGSSIQSLLNGSANLLFLPRFFEEFGPGGFRRAVIRMNSGFAPDDGLQKSLAPYKPEQGPGPVAVHDCAAVEPLIIKAKLAAPPEQIADIDAHFQSIECFLRRLNISETRISYSAWDVLYQIKSKMNLLTVWLLPGLYGLLGACVYLMRDLVLVRRAQLGRDTSVLSILSLVLRVALGGLAGIIIGWFWVPTSSNSEFPLQQISSIPFGIAFLAGFSIETLFSLLDRLNQAIESRPPPKAA
jgi:hypothetical protein